MRRRIERAVRAVPPALWLATLSAVSTSALLALWLPGAGGVHALSTGQRQTAQAVRDASPSLAAQSYYDALRSGRPEAARGVSVGEARAMAESLATGSIPRELRGVPRSGHSTLRLDETHRIDAHTLRLIGALVTRGEGFVHELDVEFDVRGEGAVFRVARMDLSSAQ